PETLTADQVLLDVDFGQLQVADEQAEAHVGVLGMGVVRFLEQLPRQGELAERQELAAYLLDHRGAAALGLEDALVVLERLREVVELLEHLGDEVEDALGRARIVERLQRQSRGPRPATLGL